MAQGIKGSIEQDITVKLRINAEAYAEAQALATKQGIKFSQLVRNLLAEAVLADQGKDPIENNIKNFLEKIVK